MIKLVDLTYYSHTGLSDPGAVLAIHKESAGFAPYIRPLVEIEFVKHLNFEGRLLKDNIPYSFFKRKNKSWSIPFATHRYIKKLQPDVVLVQGLVFPLPLLFLKLVLDRNVKFIVQHHGERPGKGWRAWLQKAADKCIDAYIFTSAGNAVEWIDRKIIAGPEKCFEILEASSSFQKQDKEKCKKELGLRNDYNFLWIGHLNVNKDPLTAVTAFEQYLVTNPLARLYFIFQTDELLPGIKSRMQKNKALNDAIVPVGKVPHDDIPKWLSAADFYISASHKEGSGYALLEAMACGCIPVVTDIPSFRKITDSGRFGLLFEKGRPGSLLNKLNEAGTIDRKLFADEMMKHFHNNLSHKKIAEDVHALCKKLVKSSFHK